MKKLSLEEIKKRIYPLELIGEYKNNKTNDIIKKLSEELTAFRN